MLATSLTLQPEPWRIRSSSSSNRSRNYQYWSPIPKPNPTWESYMRRAMGTRKTISSHICGAPLAGDVETHSNGSMQRVLPGRDRILRTNRLGQRTLWHRRAGPQFLFDRDHAAERTAAARA